MKALIGVCVVALSVAAVAAETKLGAGVTLKEATPVKALIEKPADYVGKTIRVDGIATAVCEHMGCWMAIAPENDPNGTTVRLKVEDGKIVLPVSAKGKKVSAEGVFEVVDEKDGEAKEAAGEHAKKDPKASKTYQLKGTGVVIH
jgi:hypothetical protein